MLRDFSLMTPKSIQHELGQSIIRQVEDMHMVRFKMTQEEDTQMLIHVDVMRQNKSKKRGKKKIISKSNHQTFQLFNLLSISSQNTIPLAVR